MLCEGLGRYVSQQACVLRTCLPAGDPILEDHRVSSSEMLFEVGGHWLQPPTTDASPSDPCFFTTVVAS